MLHSNKDRWVWKVFALQLRITGCWPAPKESEGRAEIQLRLIREIHYEHIGASSMYSYPEHLEMTSCHNVIDRSSSHYIWAVFMDSKPMDAPENRLTQDRVNLYQSHDGAFRVTHTSVMNSSLSAVDSHDNTHVSVLTPPPPLSPFEWRQAPFHPTKSNTVSFLVILIEITSDNVCLPNQSQPATSFRCFQSRRQIDFLPHDPGVKIMSNPAGKI